MLFQKIKTAGEHFAPSGTPKNQMKTIFLPYFLSVCPCFRLCFVIATWRLRVLLRVTGWRKIFLKNFSREKPLPIL
jgi:hypothetical protein